MARKASDLLDVFRLSDERDEAEAHTKRAKPKSTTSAKKSKRPARSARVPDKVVLSRKHLLYAGSVMFMLLALAFVLGIAAGSDAEAPDSALRRETPAETWYARGRLPKLDWTDSQPIDIRSIVRSLGDRYGVEKDMLSVRQTAENYFVYLGPFRTRDEVQRYLEIRAIDRFSAGGQFPFARPKIVKGKTPTATSDR